MTIKQKALLQTFGIIAGIVFGSIAINLILYFVPSAILLNLFYAVLAGFIVYCIYGLVLSRLEYSETLKNINSKG
jgi:hypothetical protein